MEINNSRLSRRTHWCPLLANKRQMQMAPLHLNDGADFTELLYSFREVEQVSDDETNDGVVLFSAKFTVRLGTH